MAETADLDYRVELVYWTLVSELAVWQDAATGTNALAADVIDFNLATTTWLSADVGVCRCYVVCAIEGFTT